MDATIPNSLNTEEFFKAVVNCEKTKHLKEQIESVYQIGPITYDVTIKDLRRNHERQRTDEKNTKELLLAWQEGIKTEMEQ